MQKNMNATVNAADALEKPEATRLSNMTAATCATIVNKKLFSVFLNYALCRILTIAPYKLLIAASANLFINNVLKYLIP
jgi:hypothetical protein